MWLREPAGRVLMGSPRVRPGLFRTLAHACPPSPQPGSRRTATGLYHGDPLLHQPRESRRPGWEAGRPEPPCPGEEEQAPTPPEEAAAAAAEPVPATRRLWRLRPVRVPQLRLGWCRQPRGARLQPPTRSCPAAGAT